MSAIFVTSTGTDIGKTFVTAGLIRHFRRQGGLVSALKPVISGFDENRPEHSDPAILLSALGRSGKLDAITEISPWRFRAPLSPDMAARREGKSIDFKALVDFCSQAVAFRPDLLFIEGIGGVMVPLDSRHTVLDWIVALRVPLLLVAGSYLGAISHTLTALDVMLRHRLDVAAVVVSETEGSAVPLNETVAAIARFAAPIPVAELARIPAGRTEEAAFARIAALMRLSEGRT